jgi:glycosyl transferase, family 25
MWPAHVINLDANTARLAAVGAALHGQDIAFSRIDAVNGWALTPEEIARAYDARRNAFDARQPLVPAEIGCYLSHIEAWRRIAAGEAGGGFVFEDDFCATSDLARVMTALSEDTADGWDMVKLFTLAPEVDLAASREILDGVRIGIPYRVPTCLIGYGLTRSAAKRLVDRALPFFRPVDEDQKYVWETGLRVALVSPSPVMLGDQQAVTGTIGKARRDARRTGLGQLIRKLRDALRYRMALARHRKKEGWRI